MRRTAWCLAIVLGVVSPLSAQSGVDADTHWPSFRGRDARGIADGDSLAEFRKRTLGHTCLAGHAGLPQISLPAAEVAGCPVGLSFIGWQGGDEALLDLAVRLAPFFRSDA